MYCSFFGHIELYSIYHQLTCWLTSNFQCYSYRSRETRSPHDATPHGSNPTPAEWTRVSRIQAFICWHLVEGELLLVNAVLSLSVFIILRLIDNELISYSHLMQWVCQLKGFIQKFINKNRSVLYDVQEISFPNFGMKWNFCTKVTKQLKAEKVC